MREPVQVLGGAIRSSGIQKLSGANAEDIDSTLKTNNLFMEFPFYSIKFDLQLGAIFVESKWRFSFSSGEMSSASQYEFKEEAQEVVASALSGASVSVLGTSAFAKKFAKKVDGVPVEFRVIPVHDGEHFAVDVRGVGYCSRRSQVTRRTHKIHLHSDDNETRINDKFLILSQPKKKKRQAKASILRNYPCYEDVVKNIPLDQLARTRCVTAHEALHAFLYPFDEYRCNEPDKNFFNPYLDDIHSLAHGGNQLRERFFLFFMKDINSVDLSTQFPDIHVWNR